MKADAEINTKPLMCIHCGKDFNGRQWKARVTGTGVCAACVDALRKVGIAEWRLEAMYGLRGVHYEVAL